MNEIQKRMIAVQSRLKAPKGQTNKFGGYKYRSQEDILEAVKPLLAEQELAMTICDEIVQVADRVYVKATVKVFHGSESVEVVAFAREAENKKGMDDSQITGTASSYARKYALNGMFLIDDTKDADTNEHVKSTEAKKVAKKVASNATKPIGPELVEDLHLYCDEYKDILTKDVINAAIEWAAGRKCQIKELNMAEYRKLVKGLQTKVAKKK